MYIALKKDYPSFKAPPKNGGLLTPWADRGVLLLNTCLTVRAHEPNSHAGKGWERFTQKVIDIVAQRRTRGVVFLAWGKPAGERVKKVDKSRHCILQSVHPSPLSAARGFVSLLIYLCCCIQISLSGEKTVLICTFVVRLWAFQEDERVAEGEVWGGG